MKQSETQEQALNDAELIQAIDDKESSSNQNTDEENAPCCGCCGG